MFSSYLIFKLYQAGYTGNIRLFSTQCDVRLPEEMTLCQNPKAPVTTAHAGYLWPNFYPNHLGS